MTTYSVAFLLALAVGAVLTLVVRNRALAWGLVDQATSSRKVHTRPVPRLGGIAIVLAFFAPLIALFLVESVVGQTWRNQPRMIAGLFAGGLIIAALGLYDDLRGAGAKLKFAVQTAVALLLYWIGFRVEFIASPFGEPFSLGYFALPFTVFWIVGIINALNLIDGLDGLAGGVAFVVAASNFILAAWRGDILLALCMAALAGAVLGFLVFNFNPASIFMGDTGSMFLGFVLAAVSLKTSSKSGTVVAMLVPVISLGLPIMDTLLAIIRRTAMGRPIFSADKEHMHHRLMSRFRLSHRQAVLVLYGFCVFLAMVALGLSFANGPQSALLLVAVAVTAAIFVRRLGYLSFADRARTAVVRRKNLELRAVVRQISAEVEAAETIEQIWAATWSLCGALNASTLRLKVKSIEKPGELLSFEIAMDAGGAAPFTLSVPLDANDPTRGELVVEWRDGRETVDRDEELVLEVISDSVLRRYKHVADRPAQGRVLRRLGGGS
ncbi:MAG: undecaprenyl/decaprenyl-phosphate alpha-N-acetylglucosaminyl 1-phosphate transferase [Myxococcaceae bacterium]|nr:undecaprenyl/decaprenyl-phosphate alpha-N-acetylglucosaminyl 1-phosphate transferase [Myxococcaceae bacterium]